jgi:hypothetical protein
MEGNTFNYSALAPAGALLESPRNKTRLVCKIAQMQRPLDAVSALLRLIQAIPQLEKRWEAQVRQVRARRPPWLCGLESAWNGLERLFRKTAQWAAEEHETCGGERNPLLAKVFGKAGSSRETRWLLGVCALVALAGLALLWRELIISGHGVFLLIAFLWIELAAVQAARILQRRRLAMKLERAQSNQCVQCGYDLTANVSGRCPECGTAIPA